MIPLTTCVWLSLAPALLLQGKKQEAPSTKGVQNRVRKTEPAGKPVKTSEQKARVRLIRKKILEQKARARDDRLVLRSVKVRVRLRNGESLLGVVKGGRFIEKPKGLEFVPADIRTKGAGIRLWYYDNTDGYIFLPYTLIRTYKVLKTLSDVEIKEIREGILKNRVRAEEEGRRRKEELARRAEERKKMEKASKKLEEIAKRIEEEKKAKAEQDRLLALVKEYPPSKGWGPEKIEEIRIRKVALGVFPDERSKRFIEVYEDWKKGVELQKKIDAAKAASKEGAPGSKPAGEEDHGTTGKPPSKEEGETAGPSR